MDRAAVFLTVLMLGCTQVASKEEKKGVTLTFVFDSTGSMTDDLQHVKDGTQAIFKLMYEHPDKPIYNYALVPFNDPSVGPALVTTDPVKFNNSLKGITVEGGGDCPEMAMAGIKLGVEKSLPGSYLYVFTDASAKDYYLRPEVEALIQRKQTQVVFVLTGDCIGVEDPAFKAYGSIAATSSGQVFNVKKHEVGHVLKYIKESVQDRNKVVIVAVDKPDAGETTFHVPVDATMVVLTMALSGKDPRINVKDPHGNDKEGDKILDVPGGLVIKITKPEPGIWTVGTSSTSGHTFRVTSVSNFSFDYGFSAVPTDKMAETVRRPLGGAETSLLISVTSQTELSHLTKLNILDNSGSVLQEFDLNPVPDHPYLYTIARFTPPTNPFKLKVHGESKNGTHITRISPTSITPQPPAPPFIEIPATVAAGRGLPFDIKCHVESHIPFTAVWLKDGVVYGAEETFKQTADFMFHLAEATKSSEGKYTCRAKNIAGTTSQHTQLTIIAPPPKVSTPEEITVRPGRKEEIPCEVESEVPYTVSWMVTSSRGSPHTVSGPRFEIKSAGNLVIDPVTEEDGGLYECIAESTVGDGKGIVHVKVREPVHVTVTPSSLYFEAGEAVVLSCSATGSPPLRLMWNKDGEEIEASEHSDSISKVHLKDMNSTSQGRYQCIASNDIDTDSAEAVLEYQEQPTATSVESSKEALRGTGVLLECIVTGVPRPDVSWSLNGETIIPGSDFFILDDGSLSIPAVNYGGEYKCSATNRVGKSEAAIMLEVGTKAEFVITPEDADVEILSDDSIQCEVHGEPAPSVVWRRKDDRVIDSERFKQDGESCALKIYDADVEDEGTYIVTIRNKFGEEEKEVDIAITGILPPVLDKSDEFNMTAVAPEFIELSCKVLDGYPPPSITWYKDGELVDTTLDGCSIEANGSLIIPFVTMRSEGQYECEATNIGGKARKILQLSVLEPPRILQPKRSTVKVRKGKDIWLPCTVFSEPKADVNWKKDGELLRSSRSIGRSTKDDSIFIKRAEVTNNGTYTCVASNSVGTQEKNIDVLVIEPPKIAPHEEEVFEVEDRPITLECRVSAFPPAEIKWFKNGEVLSEDHITFSDDNSTISFDAQSSDSGLYECIATNIGGEDTSATNVTVMIPPEFDVSEEVILVKRGRDVTLHCYTEAVPPAEYFWSNSAGTPLDTNEIQSSSLTIYNAQPAATGAYICEANNYAGNSQKIFFLKVTVPPKINENLPEQEDLIKGADFDLPCSADGSPPPVITWQKNGKVFFSPDTGEDNILKIRGATPKDAGLYTCTAVNSEGADQKAFILNVLVPPVMELTGETVEVEEGAKSVILYCPAIEANPLPTINWYKDRIYLDSRRNYHKLFKDNGKSLKIRAVTVADEGEYTCVATNSAGRSMADIEVKVLKKPTFVNQQLFPTRTEIEGATIELDCIATGKPTPQVSWYRNGHPLFDIVVPGVRRSDDNHTLQIERLQVTDTGKYHCVAENKVGRIERAFTLEVFALLPEAVSGSSKVSEWDSWSPWSACSASCGDSQKVRVRSCKDETIGCVGNREEYRRCMVPDCQIDGGWAKWSQWTSCSTSCGSGQRKRFRKCSKPAPRNGGKPCPGSREQYEICNPKPCPVNGGWSEWSEWSPCGGPCSNSTRQRFRQCTDPAPAFGGEDCIGEDVQYFPCIQTACPVDGVWSAWSSWSPCSATCGPSTRMRSRTCAEDNPCSGDAVEVEQCAMEVCDGVPLKGFFRLKGIINEQPVNDIIYDVQVTDLLSQRDVEAHIKDILGDQPGWFPYLQFFLSPLVWSTAYQEHGAFNGYTLTEGRFLQETHITFDSGETLVLKHTSHGVGLEDSLEMDVEVQGETPLFPLGSTVTMEPYEEDYIQTGPRELFVTSGSTMDASGISSSFSWQKVIAYESDQTMPYLAETLRVWDVKDEFNPSSSKLSYKTSSAIGKRSSNNCPDGFLQIGSHCEDIDECADPRLNGCHLTQTCENHKGSYKCNCPSGLHAASIGAPCLDIDECTEQPNICSHYCTNIVGSYNCLCPPGLVLLDDKTTCSPLLVEPLKWGKDTENVSDTPVICLPGFVEVDGICREEDPCKDRAVMCLIHEICISTHGLFRCLAAPCPEGYTRDPATKDCLMRCTDKGSRCDTEAEIMQIVKYIVLSPDISSIAAYQDITQLPVKVEEDGTRLYSSFRISENEGGKPFRVKMDSGEGVLYSIKNLPGGEDYRAIVDVSTYAVHEERLLYSTKFIVLIRLSDDTTSILR